jgi:hypothetical protein
MRKKFYAAADLTKLTAIFVVCSLQLANVEHFIQFFSSISPSMGLEFFRAKARRRAAICPSPENFLAWNGVPLENQFTKQPLLLQQAFPCRLRQLVLGNRRLHRMADPCQRPPTTETWLPIYFLRKFAKFL